MDLIHALTARYCIRQDARGFIELWALLVAVAGAAIALLLSLRRRIGDRTYRLVVVIWAGALTCFLALTLGFALTIFRWCYESAAANLGFVAPNAPAHLDMMSCLSMRVLNLVDGWILIVALSIAAIALLVLAIFRLRSLWRRALTFAGVAVALLFAVASGGLKAFGIYWCQSSRLF